MKKKHLIHICFLLPFVLTAFNVQVFITRLVSEVIAQLIAYGNLGLIFLGMSLMFKNKGEFSKTAKLWVVFYIIYYSFAIVAGTVYNHPSSILVSIIPFVYVLGFYLYLSVPENRKVFKYTAVITFALLGVFNIYLFNIQFSLDKAGPDIYMDRSSGVYGDANNTALATILAFILVFKGYNPVKKVFKIFKILILLLMFYGLFITFSNTGFMVFIVSLILLNHKFFTGIRLIFGLVLLPVVYILLANLNNITADMNLVGQQRDKINNIVNIVTFNTDKVDDSGRNYLVMKLIRNYLFEHPILGNGVDFAISQHAHNTVVGVWADAGVFTFLFFMYLLLRYFIQAIQSPPNIRYFAIPILLTFCIFMLSLQSVINQPYLMALIVFLGYVVDNKESDEI